MGPPWGQAGGGRFVSQQIHVGGMRVTEQVARGVAPSLLKVVSVDEKGAVRAEAAALVVRLIGMSTSLAVNKAGGRTSAADHDPGLAVDILAKRSTRGNNHNAHREMHDEQVNRQVRAAQLHRTNLIGALTTGQ